MRRPAHRGSAPSALICASILLIAGLPLFAQEPVLDEFMTVPAIKAKIQDLWQRYQQVSAGGDPELSELLAEQIVSLRIRSGSLGDDKLARAFAMRGWRHLEEGRLRAAARELGTAVRLEPSAREYRVGLAAARAAANPLDVFSYMPMNFSALTHSLASLRGRYLLLNDAALWLGLLFVAAGALWVLTMAAKYLRSLHHLLQETLGLALTVEIGSLVAIVVLICPAFFGIAWQWWVLGIFAGLWPFQKRSEQLLSVASIALLWLGTGLLMFSDQVSSAMTTLPVRAAISADRLDGDEPVVRDLERRLVQEGVIEVGEAPARIRPILDRWQKLELFIYGLGQRKLGKTAGAGGLRILEIFEALDEGDELGQFARVNTANILLENQDYQPVRARLEGIAESSSARPYALFNLWRLKLEMPTPSPRQAQQHISDLISEWPDFAHRFNVSRQETAPVLIDAPPPARALEDLFRRGLAQAAEVDAQTIGPGMLLLRNLVGNMSFAWAVAAVFGMLAARLVIRITGTAAVCPSCGKAYCKQCDLDPRMAKICQACAAVKSEKVKLDTNLKYYQLGRIYRYGKLRKLRLTLSNLAVPGMGTALAGRPLVGAALLGVWAALVSFIYALDRFTRLEAFPFFSHWSILSWLLIALLAAGSYAPAVWLTLRDKDDGAKR